MTFKAGDTVKCRVGNSNGLDTETVYTVRKDEKDEFIYIDGSIGYSRWRAGWFYLVPSAATDETPLACDCYPDPRDHETWCPRANAASPVPAATDDEAALAVKLVEGTLWAWSDAVDRRSDWTKTANEVVAALRTAGLVKDQEVAVPDDFDSRYVAHGERSEVREDQR
jgi:hypothetical protein